MVHIKSVIEGETYDRLNKISNPETRSDYVGIPTGLSDLDKMITGLNKSDLLILGARPGMGKTATLRLMKTKRFAFSRLKCRVTN